jgi:ricin-type beta-trefoil lectin protein
VKFRQRIGVFFGTLIVTLGASAFAIAVPASAAVPYGPYQIHAFLHEDKCLDVTDVSYANGAYLQLYDCLPSQPNQQFYLWPVPGQFEIYQIQAIHSWKCLDVKDMSYSYGARIQQYDCLGYNQRNQLWQSVWVPDTGYQKFYALHSDKYLGNYGTYNGAPVVQETSTLWFLFAAS